MASTRTQHLTLVRPDGRLQPRRPYPPLSRLNGVRKGWRVPGVLTGTRRSDSPAFDELDGGSSYQSKTPGTAFRPAHTPVGSKVWGRPFQRVAGPGRRPGRPPQRAKFLIRSEHFSLLLSFCDKKRKEKPARPAPNQPANTPQWGVLQQPPPSHEPAQKAGPCDPLKAAAMRP